VVHSVCATFRPAAEAKGVVFDVHLSDAASGSWLGDPARLRQLLSNLVANAVKFTDEGHVRIRVECGDLGLRFSIADTGIGIAAADMPQLFKKFSQADASITRRFGGTGLGLAISLELAGLMGGTISVRSEPGEGTTLDVLLPLERLAAELAAGLADTVRPEADLSQIRILAAEDNPTNQLVMTTVLGVIGVTPQMASDGREAVEAWSRGTFDLILMDIQMPNLDGLAATREIRALESTRERSRTPIYAVTANVMKDQVAEYMAAGMDGVLAKPLSIELLYATLTDAVAQHRDAALAA